ncbi:MAG: tRNA pseudouridine(55) synthase TruB [Chloroflexi bacterium]|nr:tRNA pseudouridine(55) synthase TruB [Chloroflexota bacterium]MBT7082203.1 tRNA pseudouridine(55) synthase TruB [Chloroflexota bacterium]MBT7289902.1 tRNA pseudouridine(55) synthase TruB [Chloroflexota bacterium]
MSVDGIINAIKPHGMSSFAMVSLVRRVSGERRVGHAGTLDKPATGVLPICIGKATRVVEFLTAGRKVYRAKVKLGIVTDTYDGEGSIIEERDWSSIDKNQLERLLPSFIGTIKQVPPMYSALKRDGKPLHRLARAGVEIERKPRDIDIYSIDILDWQPPYFTIDVECGKGTYIRSLAYDIGQTLGCGAHLANLIRTRNGIFDMAGGLTVDQIEEVFSTGNWQDVLHPLDSVLGHMSPATVDSDTQKNIKNGISIELEVENPLDDQWCRVYSEDGRFIALLKYDQSEGKWHPSKVFI